MGLKQSLQKTSWYLAKKPLIKSTECGDTGIIQEFDNKVFIGIVDVLGHGKEAHKIAVIATDLLKNNYRMDLTEIMKSLHLCLKEEARGAVVGLCFLDLKRGILKYVGIGNITLRKFGSNTIRIVPRDGVVGYMMSPPREETMILYDDDVLILHTDGVKEHFNLEDYPEILKDSAKKIAQHIIRQFGKKTDDALCIVLRFKK